MNLTDNIIANNCVGARLMRKLNIENANPFCWTIIDFKAILTVLNTYDSINWLNFSFTSCKPDKNKQVFYGITVDNQFTIWFPHVIKDSSCKLPKVVDINVHIDDVEQYLTQTYKRRAERMLNAKVKPTFVISQSVGFEYLIPHLTKEQLQTIEQQAKDKFNIIFTVLPEDYNINLKDKVLQTRDTISTAQNVINKTKKINCPQLKTRPSLSFRR